MVFTAIGFTSAVVYFSKGVKMTPSVFLVLKLTFYQTMKTDKKLE